MIDQKIDAVNPTPWEWYHRPAIPVALALIIGILAGANVPGFAWAVSGCATLGEEGLLDTSGCCDLCHSVEEHGRGRFLPGPCRVVLPDGRTASVCCAAKKALLAGTVAAVGREKTTGKRGGKL